MWQQINPFKNICVGDTAKDVAFSNLYLSSIAVLSKREFKR